MYPSSRSLAAALLLGALLLAVPCRTVAAPFQDPISLQGFTGILNTPNAEVTREGDISLLYSDQKNPEWRAAVRGRADSYLFSAGFFSFAELGGRFTEAPGVMRDLSANLKLKVPFIPQGYYLPDLALGVEDLGGGSAFFKSRYLVATERLGPLRGSLGYGAGPDRMKGLFGGVELKACDYLYLVADHDSRESSAGLRAVGSELWGTPVSLQLTLKTSLERRPGSLDVAVGLSFPLSFKATERGKKSAASSGTPLAAPAEEPGPAETAASLPLHSDGKTAAPGARVDAPGAPGTENARRLTLQQLQRSLVQVGFQDVRLGTRGAQQVYLSYENNVFNHNELDALGIVLGMASAVLPHDLERISVVVQRKGIRVLQVSAPLRDLREFYAGRDGVLDDTLQVTNEVGDDAAVDYLDGEKNGIYFKPALVLWPGLTTFLGTEVGAFDYLLSLKADLLVNLWPGGITDIRGAFPAVWSKNLDSGGRYRDYRRGISLERAMQFQAVLLPANLYAMLGVGKIMDDTNGTLNELIWSSPGGAHRFRVKQAYAEDSGTREKTKVYLGSYRYYWAPLDLFVEGTAGRFWGQDTGATLEMKRFFGDTSLSVYYKNTRTPQGEKWQVGGMQVVFPLTPRKDMKPVPAQVRGIEEWSYAQETVISTGGPNSILETTHGVNPQMSVNLETTYFNRDRLNRAYLLAHLQRLRDAYDNGQRL
jgi:hypothetical protein